MTTVQGAGWPSYLNDAGDGTSGTIGDVAFFNLMRDAINALIHTATNPTVTPAQVTDEVVNARGSKTTLDARLDVSLNEDGTLKSQANLITTGDFQAGWPGQRNLARNSDMTFWAAGASAAPDNWSVTNNTIVRAGSGESDTTQIGAGKYTAKLTPTGATAKFLQQVYTTSEFTNITSIRGKVVAFGIWVQAPANNTVQLVIDDGNTVTTGSLNATNGVPEFISVSATINSPSASKLDVYVLIPNSIGSNFYVSGLTGAFANQVPTFWAPPIETPTFKNPPQWHHGNNTGSQITVASGILTSYTGAGVSTTTAGGDMLLLGYTIPHGTLDKNGKVLHLTIAGTTAANANNKTLKFKGDAAGTTMENVTGAFNAQDWWMCVEIVRLTSTTARVIARLNIASQQNVTLTAPWTLGGGRTWDANDILIGMYGTAATTNGDITANMFDGWISG